MDDIARRIIRRIADTLAYIDSKEFYKTLGGNMSNIITFEKDSKKLITANFYEYEFACHGLADHEHIMDKDFVVKLQYGRDHLNNLAKHGFIKKVDPGKDISFTINRGYSCAAHNATIPGSAPDSEHINGIAADVRINNISGIRYDKIALVAYDLGFTGIGVYHNRIHLDIRDPRGLPFGVAFWNEPK